MGIFRMLAERLKTRLQIQKAEAAARKTAQLEAAEREEALIIREKMCAEVEETLKPHYYEYWDYIDQLPLSKDEKKVLVGIITPEAYLTAVSVAKMQNPDAKIYTVQEIVEKMKSLEIEQLKEICRTINDPRLGIVPDGDFREKVRSADNELKGQKLGIIPAGDVRQYITIDDTIIDEDPDSPWYNPPSMEKPKIVIVGLGDYNPPSPSQYATLAEERDASIAILKEKGMHLAGKDEYLTAMLLSFVLVLRKKNSMSSSEKSYYLCDSMHEILDLGRGSMRIGPVGTVTYIDPESLTKSSNVVGGYFGFRGSCDLRYHIDQLGHIFLGKITPSRPEKIRRRKGLAVFSLIEG
jgi:hypothetical protein